MASSMSAFNCASASLPFLICFASGCALCSHCFCSRSNDGKLMLPAEVIAQAADVVIGLFTVMIFFMVDVISGAENDVVVDVSFIYMGADNVRVFSL